MKREGIEEVRVDGPITVTRESNGDITIRHNRDCEEVCAYIRLTPTEADFVLYALGDFSVTPMQYEEIEEVVTVRAIKTADGYRVIGERG